jgi:hypothetical protein
VLLNRTLLIYKFVAAGVIILAVLMALFVLYRSGADPVVVVERCGVKNFFEGKRDAVKITDTDVKEFAEEWIKLRYTWSDFDPDKIAKRVEPISTEGFKQKLIELLTKKGAQGKDQKAQKLEEIAANIRITLTDKEVLAIFDRIVRINGIPIVVPSEVSLQVIQGSVSNWNPLGLYVNGVVEHEDK